MSAFLLQWHHRLCAIEILIPGKLELIWHLQKMYLFNACYNSHAAVTVIPPCHGYIATSYHSILLSLSIPSGGVIVQRWKTLLPVEANAECKAEPICSINRKQISLRWSLSLPCSVSIVLGEENMVLIIGKVFKCLTLCNMIYLFTVFNLILK